jgi:hypothetical protein
MLFGELGKGRMQVCSSRFWRLLDETTFCEQGKKWIEDGPRIDDDDGDGAERRSEHNSKQD